MLPMPKCGSHNSRTSYALLVIFVASLLAFRQYGTRYFPALSPETGTSSAFRREDPPQQNKTSALSVAAPPDPAATFARSADPPHSRLLTDVRGTLSREHDWIPAGTSDDDDDDDERTSNVRVTVHDASRARRCLSSRRSSGLGNHFVFMGDSTMQFKANAFSKIVGLTNRTVYDSFSLESWDETGEKRAGGKAAIRVDYVRNEMLTELNIPEAPDVFLFGSNLWFQKTSKYFPPHQKDLDLGNVTGEEKMQIYLERLKSWGHTVSRWDRTISVFVLQNLIYPGHKEVTNAGVSDYNAAAREFLGNRYPSIVVWASGRALTEQAFLVGRVRLMMDFIHLTERMYKKQMQIFLNFLCMSSSE